ncbi:MAG: hypothetical protein ACTHMW_09800 [Actinomycetes bacterium]
MVRPGAHTRDPRSDSGPAATAGLGDGGDRTARLGDGEVRTARLGDGDARTALLPERPLLPNGAAPRTAARRRPTPAVRYLAAGVVSG